VLSKVKAAGIYSTHAYVLNAYTILFVKCEGRTHLLDLNVDGVILKLILKWESAALFLDLTGSI
jgi:hypothetical protein